MKHKAGQSTSAHRSRPEWCLGVGSIRTTQQGKQVHLRYLSNEPLVQAGIICCAAGCALSASINSAIVADTASTEPSASVQT